MAEWPDLRPILWPEVRFYCGRPDVHYTKNHRKTRNKPQQKYFYCGFEWCHRESNQGHKDFQSFALPTELWHQFSLRTTLSFDWDCKGRHFFIIHKDLQQKYSKNLIYTVCKCLKGCFYTAITLCEWLAVSLFCLLRGRKVALR